jgi:hypothetical protein
MIKYFINYLKCKIKGHNLIEAGSCPFTGLTYKACTKCGNMFPVDKSK